MPFSAATSYVTVGVAVTEIAPHDLRRTGIVISVNTAAIPIFIGDAPDLSAVRGHRLEQEDGLLAWVGPWYFGLVGRRLMAISPGGPADITITEIFR